MRLAPFKISIVILNWNGKQDTLECLKSLGHLNYSNYNIIVVDNGSTDDSCAVIRSEFPNVILLEQQQNLGFAAGCNVGIKKAMNDGSDAVCLLNNDTIVDSNFLTAYVTMSAKYPSIGILGAKILMYNNHNQLDHLGGMWNPAKAQFDFIGNKAEVNALQWDEQCELDYVCGAAFFVKKEVFNTIGFLEEPFFLIWEEADFCFRAKKAGFLVKSCLDAIIFHKVSASFTSKAHSTYFWWRNRLYWIQRNCSLKERKKIYRDVLKKEVLHLYKIKTIKSLEMFVITKLLRKKLPSNKAEKLHKYRAAWQGIKDAYHGKMGQGPAWIYKKPQDVFNTSLSSPSEQTR
ncbi:MAG: glycosyltransferase family 2 protein [Chlamydiae bacterium]|nr:glycosyltransferase family 2 protein [Chlamydiota bacterium]